jgi:hypothetical protein
MDLLWDKDHRAVADADAIVEHLMAADGMLDGCDRAIPSPNRLSERFAYKIKRLLKNVALLYSPGSHANELDAGP